MAAVPAGTGDGFCPESGHIKSNPAFFYRLEWPSRLPKGPEIGHCCRSDWPNRVTGAAQIASITSDVARIPVLITLGMAAKCPLMDGLILMILR